MVASPYRSLSFQVVGRTQPAAEGIVMMVGLETQVVYLYHSAPVESQEVPLIHNLIKKGVHTHGVLYRVSRVLTLVRSVCHIFTVKWYLPV